MAKDLVQDQDPKRILVTGGAGFIGSHLAEALLAAGHRVSILDDLSTGMRKNLPGEATFHELDLGSPEAAEVVRQGNFDAIFHQAAQMNVRRSVEDVAFDARVNILGTLNLLEAAREGGVGQVVFSSTGGAIYGEQESFPAVEEHPVRPVSPYGVSKLSCEAYLYFFHQAYDLNVTCLRYGNVYGPRQNPLGEAGVVAIFLQRLLNGQDVTINGDGLQTRDYIFIGDVVRANRAALGRPGYHIYNVGTGIETSVKELFVELEAILQVGTPARFGPAKAGEQRRSSIDPSRGREELNLPMPVSLADGLRETAAWFRENP